MPFLAAERGRDRLVVEHAPGRAHGGELQLLLGAEMGEQAALAHAQVAGQAGDREVLEPFGGGELHRTAEDRAARAVAARAAAVGVGRGLCDGAHSGENNTIVRSYATIRPTVRSSSSPQVMVALHHTHPAPAPAPPLRDPRPRPRRRAAARRAAHGAQPAVALAALPRSQAAPRRRASARTWPPPTGATTSRSSRRTAAGAPVAIARFVRLRDRPQAADIAAEVVDARQRQGIGSDLIVRLARRAAAVGVRASAPPCCRRPGCGARSCGAAGGWSSADGPSATLEIDVWTLLRAR